MSDQPFAARLEAAKREVTALARDSTLSNGAVDLFLIGKTAGLALALSILSNSRPVMPSSSAQSDGGSE